MARKSVATRLAYAWDCPSCRRKNYGEHEPIQLDEDEQEAIEAACGYDRATNEYSDGGPMELVGVPEVVACCNCGIVYDVAPADFEEE